MSPMNTYLVAFYKAPGVLSHTYVMESALSAGALCGQLDSEAEVNGLRHEYPDCAYEVEGISA